MGVLSVRYCTLPVRSNQASYQRRTSGCTFRQRLLGPFFSMNPQVLIRMAIQLSDRAVYEYLLTTIVVDSSSTAPATCAI